MTVINQQSVQSLLLQMEFNGQPLSTGTGFTVQTSNGPYLITNRHNVTGRRQDNDEPLSTTGGIPSDIVIFHNRKGRLGEWITAREPLYVDDQPRWKEHPTLGARADFVALKLSQLDDVEIIPHDVNNPGPPILLSPADVVSVIGFPFGRSAGGIFGIWCTGFLASEPQVDFDDLPLQLIDCRSRPGQSGSPVLLFRSGGGVPMEDGGTAIFGGQVSRFIGIYSGRINAESDLGIVWKTSAIAQLVQTL
jgi:hypothetical protein